jgi:hypothetical protein
MAETPGDGDLIAALKNVSRAGMDQASAHMYITSIQREEISALPQ